MVTLRPGVHHLAVLVHDLVRAEQFYVGVLGLSIRKRWADDDGAPRSIWLDLGDGAFLALERAKAGAVRSDQAPGWHCIALRIDCAEREPWRARLTAAGVSVERESDYTLYLRDPDGTLVALSHYPEQSSTSGPDSQLKRR